MAESSVPNAPDWGDIHREILCPLCEYNLRGLVEPRCPECGHQFQWSEVLMQGDRVHPFLFEHQAHRPYWSFLKTLAASQLPMRFWKTVLPIHAPVPRRLLLYWGILLAIVLIWCIFMTGLALPGARDRLTAIRAAMTTMLNSAELDPYWADQVRRHGSVAATVDARFPPPTLWGTLQYMVSRRWRIMYTILPLSITLIAWPWVTLTSLMVFRISMNRARIKTGHVFRCVIYAHDSILLALPLVLTITLFQPFLWILFVFPLIVIAIVRLWLSYRFYLRFPHSLATIAASQIVVGMTMMKVWLTLQGF